jgi:Arc/MetJ-type ribon-helix-helix transcriptional regulator
MTSKLDLISGSRDSDKPESIILTVKINPFVHEDLKRLVESGYFGDTAEEAAGQLIREALRMEIGEPLL